MRLPRPYHLLTYWILLASGLATAQGVQRKIDSLNLLIGKTGDRVAKVRLMNALVFELIPVDIAKATDVAEQAVEEAEKSGKKDGLAWALIGQATCLQTEGETRRAESIIYQALDLNVELNDQSIEGYGINLLGNTYRDKGRFDSAHFHYNKARRTMAGVEDPIFPMVHHLEIARYFIILERPDSAIYHIDKVILGIKKGENLSVLREALILKAAALGLKFKYTESESLLDRALSMTESFTTAYLRAMYVRGRNRFNQGDFAGALAIWRKTLDNGRQLGYKYDLGVLILGIAEAYEEQGFWKISNEYLNTCLDLSKKGSYNFLRGEVLYEKAWIAYRSANFKDAWSYIGQSASAFEGSGQSLKIAGCNNVRGLISMGKKNYDSSLYYHKLSLAVREKTANKISISSSLFNMGELFNTWGKPATALKYLWRGLAYDREIGDVYGQGLYSYQIARSYNALHRYDSVPLYLNTAIKLAVPNSSYEILQKSYIEMANFLKNTGKPMEAVRYLEKYITITDSIHSKQSTQTVAAYETLFELDSKEKEISLLSKDRELALADARLQLYVLYGLAAGTVILIIILLVYTRVGKRLKKLNEANEEKARNLNLQAVELGKANAALKDLFVDLQGKHRELQEALESLQRAQEQLVKSEKMASLGVLAAGIAHELNNPLNFIKGGVSTLEIHLAKDGDPADGQIQTYLNIIQEGVNRASAILRGLGQYSRQSDEKSEPCDVHKILDNCLVILANSLKYHVKVEKAYCETPFMITGNEGKLHQAFINIISNAEQAIVGEGTITIRTAVEDKGRRGVLIISDTGSGISAENLRKLGDLFFTTKPPGKGTGLGLSIAYKIIQEHRGKVSVTSEIGKGTNFILTFTL